MGDQNARVPLNDWTPVPRVGFTKTLQDGRYIMSIRGADGTLQILNDTVILPVKEMMSTLNKALNKLAGQPGGGNHPALKWIWDRLEERLIVFSHYRKISCADNDLTTTQFQVVFDVVPAHGLLYRENRGPTGKSLSEDSESESTVPPSLHENLTEDSELETSPAPSLNEGMADGSNSESTSSPSLHEDHQQPSGSSSSQEDPPAGVQSVGGKRGNQGTANPGRGRAPRFSAGKKKRMKSCFVGLPRLEDQIDRGKLQRAMKRYQNSCAGNNVGQRLKQRGRKTATVGRKKRDGNYFDGIRLEPELLHEERQLRTRDGSLATQRYTPATDTKRRPRSAPATVMRTRSQTSTPATVTSTRGQRSTPVTVMTKGRPKFTPATVPKKLPRAVSRKKPELVRKPGQGRGNKPEKETSKGTAVLQIIGQSIRKIVQKRQKRRTTGGASSKSKLRTSRKLFGNNAKKVPVVTLTKMKMDREFFDGIRLEPDLVDEERKLRKRVKRK